MCKDDDLRSVHNQKSQVDPDQAARAEANPSSFRPAKVRNVWGRLIEVRFDDDADTTVVFGSDLANIVAHSSAVAISERHGVLSVRSTSSDQSGDETQPPIDTPTMIAVQRVPDEFVYGHVQGYDYEHFYIVPRAAAEESADIMDLMSSCRTWGELRDRASAARFAQILDCAGFGEFDDFTWHLEVGRPMSGVYGEATEVWDKQQERGLPKDDGRFDPYEIDSFHSADWPQPLALTQSFCLPAEVVRTYGRSYETSINGTFAELEPEEGMEAVAMMEQLGFRCVEDEDLLGVVPSAWASF